jgi:ATP-dependent helicase HrpA
MEVSVGSGQRVLGYPGLVDDGDSVSLRVFDTPAEAQQAHRAGLLRLFMLQFREQLKYLEKNLPGLTRWRCSSWRSARSMNCGDS